MDKKFMRRAIELARLAGERGEIPVGAVVVKDGRIIGEGSNRREEKKSALSHAETEAIAAACAELDDWRLDGCELYVTLEPCAMCTGAILNARVKTLIFGAYDLSAGCIESAVRLCGYLPCPAPEVYGGICEDECAGLLKTFFGRVRGDEK